MNLVTGFLGVGKTTAIRHLLGRVPTRERWAVLVNEFGEVGVDSHLLGDAEVAIEEVAGGCLCCVAAPAFTTGLNRLIRRYRPDRILIEPSGLGHPAQVLETLGGPLYTQVIEVRATVCLLDPRHLQSARHLAHPSFHDQIHLADVLVANKADLCGADALRTFETFVAALQPPKARLAVVEHGWLDPAWLDLAPSTDRQAAFPEAHAFLVEDGGRADAPQRQTADWTMVEGHRDGYHRVGWLIADDRRWPADLVRAFIDDLHVERKKGVLAIDGGYLAFNQDHWRAVPSPVDGLSRVELIDPHPIDSETLDGVLRQLAQCADRG